MSTEFKMFSVSKIVIPRLCPLQNVTAIICTKQRLLSTGATGQMFKILTWQEKQTKTQKESMNEFILIKSQLIHHFYF